MNTVLTNNLIEEEIVNGINPSDYQAIGESMISLAKALGIIALIGIILLMCFLWYRKRKQNKTEDVGVRYEKTAFASDCWAKIEEMIDDETNEICNGVSVYDNEGNVLTIACENEGQLLAGVYVENDIIYLVAYEMETEETVQEYKWMYNRQAASFEEC